MTDVTISEIDHIGVPVWNANDAMAFFEHTDVDVKLVEELEPYNVLAMFLDIGGTYLEFLEPIGEGNVKTFLERHGPGYQHVAYRVPDLDDVLGTMRGEGLTFQSEEPLDGAGGSRIVFLEERWTAGLQVELVERNEPL